MFESGPEVGEGAADEVVAAGPAPSGLAAALAGLTAAVDALAGCDPAGEAPVVVLRSLARLRRVRDRFDAELARVTAVADAQGEWRADGSRSLPARMARDGGEPETVARRDVHLARSLAGMPATGLAFAVGKLSRAHVDVLVWAAGGARRSLYLRDEELLVGFARTLHGSAFRLAVRSWVLAADDDLAPDPGALDLDTVGVDQRRWFRKHELLDGRLHLDGELGRVDGAQFGEAVDRIERELFAADWQDAKERLGRDPLVGELRRTPGQRLADAVVELAIRGSSAPPGAKRPRALATVLIGSEAHARLLQLARGTPITLREGLRVVLDGEIERATFDTPDRVQISDTARLFTRATRRGMEVRDLTCQFDDTRTAAGRETRLDDVPVWQCDVPAEDCEGHHDIPFEDGGPTIQENGEMLCEDHHPGRRRHQPWLTDPTDPTDPDDPPDADRPP